MKPHFTSNFASVFRPVYGLKISQKFKLHLLSSLFAVLFISGYLLVGSDGPLFPWPNLIGLVMAIAAVPVAIHADKQLEEAND